MRTPTLFTFLLNSKCAVFSAIPYSHVVSVIYALGLWTHVCIYIDNIRIVVLLLTELLCCMSHRFVAHFSCEFFRVFFFAFIASVSILYILSFWPRRGCWMDRFLKVRKNVCCFRFKLKSC